MRMPRSRFFPSPMIRKSRSPCGPSPGFFADERTLVTKTEGMKPHSVSEEKTKEPQYTSELRYVSSVTTEGKRFCFFKEEGTGRMLELSPLSDDASWSWVSEETDFFYSGKRE